MEIYYPGYYHAFHCIASACPDSCCQDWAVDVDPQSAKAYRALSGALGDKLRDVLKDTDSGTIMQIENGRCPMWQTDGLCRIHAELGHEALCKTCRQFPRLVHDYGNFQELGLELSCPEAAQLILSSASCSFHSQTQPGGEPPEYLPEDMALLRQSRETALHFLENSPFSLPETLAILLIYSHGIQGQLDGGNDIPFDAAACLVAAKKLAKAGDMASVFHFFQQLEILTPSWKNRLSLPPKQINWVPELRALMRYMLQRYWLQTIADYDLIGRVKLAVIACLLVGAMGENTIQTAQLFSKEIENDPDNVEAILAGAYASPAFTDTNLLSLLLT